MSITREDIRGAVARAWCTTENAGKVMDPALAEAAAVEVENLFRSDYSPHLGCATTKQLIDELAARADMAQVAGEDWPWYRTVIG